MISGNEVSSVVSTYLQSVSKAQGRASTPPPASDGSLQQDAVALSPRSEAVSRLISAVKQLPDVRTARVLDARTRMDAGVTPSSTDVARQILSRVVGDHLAARR